MRKIATALLGAAAVLTTTCAGPVQAAPVAAHARAASYVTLGGVRVRLHPGTRQVVTADHTSGWHAHLALWRLRNGRWERTASASDGRTGYGGLVRGTHRHQGTGTTPLGTYGLISAFGTHARLGHLPYRRIGRGDFWVEDNASRYYNRCRNQRQGGFRWRLPTSAQNGSERLTDYPTQYEYAIVTSFNHQQIRHRGAGIFLHVNGSGATGGCVSGPRPFLRTVLARLRPALHPLIAVGR
jgi:L,D-peptidoglycan transpeptidase YkuD (ErfK/YbiS/YcfS/YnhG family)